MNNIDYFSVQHELIKELAAKYFEGNTHTAADHYVEKYAARFHDLWIMSRHLRGERMRDYFLENIIQENEKR